MKRLFTKEDLKTGDIIVLRNGEPGFVHREKTVIIYQHLGMDSLDTLSIGMTNISKNAARDIMRVYRTPHRPLGFENYMSYCPIFDRDEKRVFLETEESTSIPSKHLRCGKKNKELPKYHAILLCSANRRISDIYMNEQENPCWDLLEMPSIDYKRPDISNLSYLDVPDSDGLVIVYHQFQEERWNKEKNNPIMFTRKPVRPLLSIPEHDIQLYSRCIVCKKNSMGRHEILNDKDMLRIMDYLSM